MRSSAYGSFRFLLPLIVSYGETFEFFIVRAKISLHRTKRYPAMGSPCLHPLKILNWSVGYPFTNETPMNLFLVLVSVLFSGSIILVSELPSKVFIHFLYFSPNPNIWNYI